MDDESNTQVEALDSSIVLWLREAVAHVYQGLPAALGAAGSEVEKCAEDGIYLHALLTEIEEIRAEEGICFEAVLVDLPQFLADLDHLVSDATIAVKILWWTQRRGNQWAPFDWRRKHKAQSANR